MFCYNECFWHWGICFGHKQIAQMQWIQIQNDRDTLDITSVIIIIF